MPEKLYVEADFRTAGQDSYTQPPAQDQKLFEVLENVLPVTQGPLYKRWGYSLFNNPGNIPRRLYEYQKDITGERRILVSTSDKVLSINEDGTNHNTSILSTDTSFNPSRVLVSRDFAYMANANPDDIQKWDGSQAGGTSKWGISPAIGTGTSTKSVVTVVSTGGTGGSGNEGPNSPTTAVDDGTVGTKSWAFAGNATALDDAKATIATANPATVSHYLKCTNFGFSIPTSATIDGILVEINCNGSQSGTASVPEFQTIKLINGAGTIVGNNLGTGSFPSVAAYSSFGSSSNTWAASLTEADINDVDFGVVISALFDGGENPNASIGAIDHVRITVYYTAVVIAWSNPSNVTASNDSRATSTLVADAVTQDLKCTAFAFAISTTSNIIGIEVIVERSEGSVSVAAIEDATIQLLKNGTAVGTNKAASAAWPVADAIKTYGSSTDLWGESWTAADINDTDFGVIVAAKNTGGGSEDARIDHVQIKVYSAETITVGTPVSGDVTLDIGRKYVLVLRNSATGHNSGLSLFSPSTGPITSKNVPLTTIPVATDGQVDRKVLLATADGGDETRLYFLTDIANATTTFTDNVPEETLLLQNVYLNVNFFGEERGVSGNLPPPKIAIPIKHRARIWGAGNPDNLQLLYYSKNISELVTDTGLITGRYEECWPAENFLDVSGGAESITALFSDGQTLYVASERQIRRILGDPPNLLIPEVVFNNVGVVSPEVWKPVFIEGTPAGTIFLTPDRRVCFTDFNTYRDIGGPIQDILDTLNASEIQKSRAEFFSDGPHEWYLLAIPTGANTEPDTLLVYHLKAKRWYVWKPTDSVTAMLHNVQADGTVQFLFGADTSKTYKFSASDTQDRVNSTPVSFTSTITTTWRHYDVPATLKLLNKLKIFSSDSSMTVTVDGASLQAEFTTPTNVVTDSTLVTGPLGDLELFLAGKTTKDKYYRYKFTSTANLDQSSPMLNYFEVYYIPFHVF